VKPDEVRILESLAAQIVRLDTVENTEKALNKIKGIGNAAIRTHRQNPAIADIIGDLVSLCERYTLGEVSKAAVLLEQENLRKACDET